MNIDARITRQIFLAAQLLERTTDQIFSIVDLTAKTCEILFLIEKGVNMTVHLARAMNLTPAGITQKTKVLEKKGFITRKSQEEDLRVWHFELTKKGEKVLEDIVPLYEASMKPLYSEFSKLEKENAITLLDEIVDHLAPLKKEQIAVFIHHLQAGKSFTHINHKK